MKFADLNAIVTGGASGLGLAVAERVITNSGRVALLDVNADQGNATAEKLGDNALFIQTDVADENQVNDAVAAARKSLGPLSLAVNCAGILGAKRVLVKTAQCRVISSRRSSRST